MEIGSIKKIGWKQGGLLLFVFGVVLSGLPIEKAESKTDNSKPVLLAQAQAEPDVFIKEVNNTGTIQANRVIQSGGVIHLLGEGVIVQNIGTSVVGSNGMIIIDNGSVVTVTGPEGDQGAVVLLGHIKLDTSGVTSGGDILIGGDFYGKGFVPNIQYRFVGDAATIPADVKQQRGRGFFNLLDKHRLMFDVGEIGLAAVDGMFDSLLIDVDVNLFNRILYYDTCSFVVGSASSIKGTYKDKVKTQNITLIPASISHDANCTFPED